MYLYKFELSYVKDGIKYKNTYTKFCRRYRSTKLYKNCIKELDNMDNKDARLKVYI